MLCWPFGFVLQLFLVNWKFMKKKKKKKKFVGLTKTRVFDM